MAQSEIKVILSAVDQLTGPLKQASTQIEAFGAKAKSIGKNLEEVGLRVGGIGLAGQGALSRVGLDMNTLVTGALDAEKALYGIANTAGFSGAKAKAMVGEWTLAVNQIAVATNQSQERVTAAFQDMIAKGIDPQAAVNMLKPVGQAATAAGADIQDMAAAAQASFSKLKIPVEEVGKALDIMSQSGKAGAFELRDMAGYFDKISASAANLGMQGQGSLAGLAAAAQIARRGTGDAAQAATNLDNFLGKLNAKVTYKAFDEMGADLGKLKEEAQASGDYLTYMAEAIQKITKGDTAKVSALFSDVQAGAFIQGMLRDLEDYKKIREEALGANGVAASDFATAMQSASAQVDKFKISSSAAVNGDGIKNILDSLNSVAQWAGDHPELAKWLIYGTAGLAIGGAAIAGLGAMVTAIGGIATALSGLAVFLAANPVVLTILGIAAGSYAVYEIGTYLGLDEIGKKLGIWTYDVVQILGKLPDELAAMWERWKAAGAGLIQSLKAGITEGLKGALGIGDKLKDALSYLGKMGGEWVEVGKQVMQGLLDGIKAKYKEIIAKIKGLGKDMLDSVKDVLGIQSPSKEFEQIGLYVAEGMSLGISKGTLGVLRRHGGRPGSHRQRRGQRRKSTRQNGPENRHSGQRRQAIIPRQQRPLPARRRSRTHRRRISARRRRHAKVAHRRPHAGIRRRKECRQELRRHHQELPANLIYKTHRHQNQRQHLGRGRLGRRKRRIRQRTGRCKQRCQPWQQHRRRIYAWRTQLWHWDNSRRRGRNGRRIGGDGRPDWLICVNRHPLHRRYRRRRIPDQINQHWRHATPWQHSRVCPRWKFAQDSI